MTESWNQNIPNFRQEAASVECAFEDIPSSQPHNYTSSQGNPGGMSSTQDSTVIPPKVARSRRKPETGDHKKHRRTRSGCYTCRSRRVKCDEGKPTCERCRKGNRDCEYPEEKLAKSGSSKKGAPTVDDELGSSSDEDEDDIGSERLGSIKDEDESGSAQLGGISTSGVSSNSKMPTTRRISEVPSLIQDKGASPTPSTEGSAAYSPYQITETIRVRSDGVSPTARRSDWSHLPDDIQYYLGYFYDNVTHLHYSLKYDSTNFLKTGYMEAALREEALLFAVVGFAAFQRTLHNPRGKIQDFLKYYNKAVSLLLRSLKRGERHNTDTMLAILQLATIEEFLGDWVNLLGHQKAVYQMLMELFTPKSVMDTEETRVILGWYMRFDVFAGLMGGFEAVLSRDWFSCAYEFNQKRAEQAPLNLNFKVEASISKLRLIAMDMSTVFAKMGKGEITFEQFVHENTAVGQKIAAFDAEMDPALKDPRFLVNDFSSAQPPSGSIVNPYLPGVIYRGPLWVRNVLSIDFLSIDLMHKYQTALITQAQPSDELVQKAFESCQIFESTEMFPESPPGTILALQASLGIACIFLPRDDKHAMWARRKLAKIEAHGYIYPYTFRTKMADLFRDRSCMHWWLPNDENYPPIIRSIRNFVEERSAHATDVPGEDLRDMKAIFSSLNLSDGTSPLSTNIVQGQEQEHQQPAIAGTENMGNRSVGYYDDQGSWNEGHPGRL